jgi:hypothetical protein
MWGRVWEFTREMIDSVQMWRAGEGVIAEIELKPWDQLDDITQAWFMHQIATSPAFDIVGTCMAEALNFGRAYKAAQN